MSDAVSIATNQDTMTKHSSVNIAAILSVLIRILIVETKTHSLSCAFIFIAILSEKLLFPQNMAKLVVFLAANQHAGKHVSNIFGFTIG